MELGARRARVLETEKQQALSSCDADPGDVGRGGVTALGAPVDPVQWMVVALRRSPHEASCCNSPNPSNRKQAQPQHRALGSDTRCTYAVVAAGVVHWRGLAPVAQAGAQREDGVALRNSAQVRSQGGLGVVGVPHLRGRAALSFNYDPIPTSRWRLGAAMRGIRVGPRRRQIETPRQSGGARPALAAYPDAMLKSAPYRRCSSPG